MPGILILDELQSATEGGGIKLKDPLQTQDGTPLLSPSGEVSINFDNLANNTIHMNKLNIPDDGMTGDKIHGGTISGFQSTGITDNANSTALTIIANGNVGIGTDNPTRKLDVNGTVRATLLSETSSLRYKENVRDIDSALNIISAMRGVIYDRKDGTSMNESGIIAEELYKIVPSLVKLDEEGRPDSVHYTRIIAYLIEAIKELEQKIG